MGKCRPADIDSNSLPLTPVFVYAFKTKELRETGFVAGDFTADCLVFAQMAARGGVPGSQLRQLGAGTRLPISAAPAIKKTEQAPTVAANKTLAEGNLRAQSGSNRKWQVQSEWN
jgi:hypothetical protein